MTTQTLKVRLLKPISEPWETAGPRLRELAWMAHRVLNLTMTALEMSDRLPRMAPDNWKSRVNPNSEKCPGGRLSAYQMAADAIELANTERLKQRKCGWCRGTGVEPDEPPKKKRTKKQPIREPGELCSRCDNGPKRVYTIGEAVEVPSPIQAGWARLAEQRFKSDKIDVRRGKKSLATFRDTAPIAVTSSGERFAVRHDGRSYVVDVPLYAGGHKVTFAIKPHSKRAYEHLRQILSSEVKVGDLKLLPPKRERQGWCALISYTSPDTAKVQTGETLVLSLGKNRIQISTPSTGRYKVLRGVDTMIRQRRMFAKRRKSRSRHQRDIGRGARGHGRTRALQHYRAVDDAEQRWLNSVCQEISAKAAAFAARHGARWVSIDPSVSAHLPVAALRLALDWALLKQNIAKPPEVVEAERQKRLGGSMPPDRGVEA